MRVRSRRIRVSSFPMASRSSRRHSPAEAMKDAAAASSSGLPVTCALALDHGQSSACSIFGRVYWLAIAPGVIVHELSHVIACWLMLAKVRRVKLFGPKGGEVEHDPSRIPVIGQPVISMAPIAGCALTLVLVGWLLGAPRFPRPPMTLAPFSLDGLLAFLKGWLAMVRGLSLDLGGADFTDWRVYVFIYAALCLGVALRPSGQDFRNAFLGLVVIAALIFITGLIASRLGHPGFAAKYLLGPVQAPLGHLVAFLTLVTLITIPVWVIRLLIFGRSRATS